MKKFLIRFFLPFLLSLFLLGFFSSISQPLSQAYTIKPNGAFFCDNPDDVAEFGFKCLEGIVDNVLRASLAILGIGLFAMLIVGGLRYLTSGGDQKALDGARKTVSSAVLGFFVLIVLLFILRALGDALGVRILRFEIPERSLNIRV